MIAIKERNTLQKSLIRDTVMALSTHPTADEIYEVVASKFPNISRTTVYRNLNHLSEAGEILRVEVPNAPDRYDRTVHHHAHFLCRSCGCVCDFDALNPFDDKSLNHSEFDVLGCHIIFFGYCKKCKLGGNNESKGI